MLSSGVARSFPWVLSSLMTRSLSTALSGILTRSYYDGAHLDGGSLGQGDAFVGRNGSLLRLGTLRKSGSL